MGRIQLPWITVALSCAIVPAPASAEEAVIDFVPEAAVTDAVYVEIERDPGFDEFSRRIQQAREEHSEWVVEYYREHQTADRSPLPYHENFGVSREEYEHYVEPMNHYREVARQDIRIRRSERDGHILLEFEGDDLLLTRLVIDGKANVVTTSTDELPRRSFVDLERASLPPGVHRGVLFRTPEDQIRQSNRRESLLIGEVPALEIGIIHFGLRAPEGNRRVYVRYSR